MSAPEQPTPEALALVQDLRDFTYARGYTDRWTFDLPPDAAAERIDELAAQRAAEAVERERALNAAARSELETILDGAATPPPGDNGEMQMSDLNAPNIMIGVKLVQSRLPQYWTDESYPDSFNKMPLPHRHFNHSLSHAMKALGGLAALSDAMDHERIQNRGYADPEAEQYAASAGKWLADLVICSARMAEQLHLDLDENVQHRINTLIERWGGK